MTQRDREEEFIIDVLAVLVIIAIVYGLYLIFGQ